MHPGAIVGGKYRLVRFLGEGAMGSVWEAVHVQNGRSVAVKLISGPEVLAGELRSRLLREAQACQRIQHPNVVSVIDVGELDDGAPFLVMQLLNGETLDVRLHREGRLAPVEAARIGGQVARALAAAHAAGIIHRDLKPANIYLHLEPKSSVPIAKVLDFGVSKILSERGGTGPDARATATGHAMGSPAYMSPEQAKSANKVDARADVWSLGVLLFEMLSGSLPFPGETAYAVIGEVLHGPIPSLRTAAPSLDERLAGVVDRCLVRDVNARVGSAVEVATVLEGFVREQAGARSLVNEKTEPLGSNRLRLAALQAMRNGPPDLDRPAPQSAPGPSVVAGAVSALNALTSSGSFAMPGGAAKVVTGSTGSGPSPAAKPGSPATDSFVRAPTEMVPPPAPSQPGSVRVAPQPPPSSPGSVRVAPQPTPSQPGAHVLGPRSSTAPISLVPQGAPPPSAAVRVPPPRRSLFRIGLALSLVLVSLSIAIVVLVRSPGAATQDPSASASTSAAPSAALAALPATTVDPSPTLAPSAPPSAPPAASSAAPSAAPSSPPSTAPTPAPPATTKPPRNGGKGRPIRSNSSFPSSPG
jgi:serine/threonine-protein kinase